MIARSPPPRTRRRPGLSRRAMLVMLLLALLIAAGGTLVVLRLSGDVARRPLVESIFQDDDHLLYASTPGVVRTLRALRGLGVDRLRLTILWKAIAPGAGSRTPPPGFRARDPASYPAGAWAPYDRIVELARASGIGVDFDLTAPGPLWAMAAPAPSARVADHLRPDARAFGAFVAAVGARYSGHYTVGTARLARTLPRVSFWTIWNEPNQPGWLYPQWRQVAGHNVMDSPRLYRLYLDAAFAGLGSTGHTPVGDTILIGELAPEGSKRHRPSAAIPPIPFIRALYCVDSSFHPLRGTAAALLHCPPAGQPPTAFVHRHPALFTATGFSHHPYSFFLAPRVSIPNPDFAPLANLRRLEITLDDALRTWNVDRVMSIYLTEYGYESYPPNPYRGVSLGRQALYLDQAQQIASMDPRVRALAQFLLYDAAPDLAYPRGSYGYWSTFQTGLLFHAGATKPSLAAYRLPIVVEPQAVVRGSNVRVWGMLRPAPNYSSQSVQIEWRPAHGAYRTLSTVTTSDPSGFLDAEVAVPATGALRLAWTSRSGTTIHSRRVEVTVR